MVQELVTAVRDGQLAKDEFRRRVDEEAEALVEELRAGTFDNPQAIVGLEYEFYGAHPETGALTRVPRALLDLIGFEGELGLHNAEMNTSPQPFNAHGLTTQETEVQARLSAALDRTAAENIRLVSDGMWTVPPTGESARTYLTEVVERDGVRITPNMSGDARYQAMANGAYEPARRIDLPHVSLEADTVLPESLATSIQPHFQVPDAEDLPEYFRYAVRLAAPLLALGVNSPFVPPELYDDGADPERILEEGWHENRIPVFEGVLNPVEGPAKVRFPRDVETVEAAVERLAADPPIVPMAAPTEGRFDDAFGHLRHKHGSFWRWVRPVFEGPTRSAANARIEFRPLPAQPTVRDSVAFLAAFGGLLTSLFQADHPVSALPWETARDNFEAAVRDGLDADLTWITANGDETGDPDDVYPELFESARDGLVVRGVPEPRAREYLRPLRGRYRRGVTPAAWKRREARERLRSGADLEGAIHGAQRAYLRNQARTLFEGSFLDWLDGHD